MRNILLICIAVLGMAMLSNCTEYEKYRIESKLAAMEELRKEQTDRDIQTLLDHSPKETKETNTEEQKKEVEALLKELKKHGIKLPSYLHYGDYDTMLKYLQRKKRFLK